ncbi:MAG: hypothetical protein WBG86_13090 [Polyangiales bacterium]
MIRRTIRLLWRGAVIGFVAYAFFFARLGDRTPFQHVMRIASTEEAQELGHEVGVATERITKQIGNQVYEATADLDEPPPAASEPMADQLHDIAGHTYQREPHVEAARGQQAE